MLAAGKTAPLGRRRGGGENSGQMTDREIIKKINDLAVDHLENGPYENETLQAVKLCREVMKLCSQAELEESEPLTLEELREMEGEPVWVTHKDGSGGRWGIVNIYPSGICADVCSRTAYWFEDFIGTMAYRHKPENGGH